MFFLDSYNVWIISSNINRWLPFKFFIMNNIVSALVIISWEDHFGLCPQWSSRLMITSTSGIKICQAKISDSFATIGHVDQCAVGWTNSLVKYITNFRRESVTALRTTRNQRPCASCWRSKGCRNWRGTTDGGPHGTKCWM